MEMLLDSYGFKLTYGFSSPKSIFQKFAPWPWGITPSDGLGVV